ncbi:MAG TPA: hypothetical protein VMX57_04560 [Planctomycetota bacterium]|nr:hypothetical protein [Planctomycetota bacterium]
MRVECPSCHAQLDVAEDAAGSVITCTHCQRRLRLPASREAVAQEVQLIGRPLLNRGRRTCTLSIGPSGVVECVRKSSGGYGAVAGWPVRIRTLFWNEVASAETAVRLDRRWLAWIIVGFVLYIIPGVILWLIGHNKKEVVVLVQGRSWHRAAVGLVMVGLDMSTAVEQAQRFVQAIGEQNPFSRLPG